MLKDRGYNIITKFLINENDNLSARFLECINDLGQKTFIDLDISASITANSDDPILIVDGIEDRLPHSLKNGMFECSGLEVSGIVIIYDKNIIVLIRDEDGHGPYEFKFIINNTDTNIYPDIIDEYMVYPIVKLSEIQENAQLVTENIDEVTKRLQNTIYENCKSGIKMTLAATKKLENSILEFIDVEIHCSNELAQSIHTLKDILEKYKHAPNTEENQIRYQKLLFNLRKRHEYALELINLCQKINHKRDKIIKYADYISEITTSCLKGLKDLSRPLDN